jgi:hypothetical protein
MAFSTRLKHGILACLIAAGICAMGFAMFLANIHGGSEFSRSLLKVLFPAVFLADRFFNNELIDLLALVSGYLLWAVLAYLFLGWLNRE